MGDAFLKLSDTAVGGEHGVRVLHERTQVALVNAKEDSRGTAFRVDFQDQFDLVVERVRAALELGGFDNILSIERSVLIAGDNGIRIILTLAALQFRFHLPEDLTFLYVPR